MINILYIFQWLQFAKKVAHIMQGLAGSTNDTIMKYHECYVIQIGIGTLIANYEHVHKQWFLEWL